MSSQSVITIENLSKYYRLGLIGGGTLREDVNRAWAKMRGRPDPLLKIGETDHGNRKGDMIWALRDIDLEVKEGEILGVIGRNGAGKSTLLKILSRITAPTEGRAVIRGRVGSLLEVGTGFHPELTGRENTYLNGTILGMSKREVAAKLEEIVEFAEMGKFIDTPVKRYSSGMLVRLAFAVAAHLEPEILIIDEVLAVGDVAFQKKCLGKMKDVSSQGRTVLFVSHNMTSVEMLCTAGIVLDGGSIVSRGTASEAVGHYLRGTGDGNVVQLDQPDRKGSQNVVFQDIRIGSSESPGVATEPVCSGDEIVIEAIIECRKSRRGPVDIDIAVDDRRETRLFWMSTHLLGTSLYDLKEGVYSVSFTIPKLPLYPGSYSLTTCIRHGMEVEDWIKDSVFFEVKHGQFFDHNSASLDKKSQMLVDFKVNIN